MRVLSIALLLSGAPALAEERRVLCRFDSVCEGSACLPIREARVHMVLLTLRPGDRFGLLLGDGRLLKGQPAVEAGPGRASYVVFDYAGAAYPVESGQADWNQGGENIEVRTRGRDRTYAIEPGRSGGSSLFFGDASMSETLRAAGTCDETGRR